MLAPIVLFAYNRPLHLQKTIEALLKNPLAKESSLYIYADGAKGTKDQNQVREVKEYLQTLQGFKEISLQFRTENWGLARNVIAGVSEVLAKHQKAIVLEDDMLCSEDFLGFMNDALVFYEKYEQIFTITGYNFPIQIPDSYTEDVYFHPRSSSWGWATWQDRWQKSDWEMLDFQEFIHNPKLQKQFNAGGEDLTAMLLKQQIGKNDSWSVRWTYAHFKHQALCVYPTKSKINNIGLDNSGVHSPKTKKYEANLSSDTYRFSDKITIDNKIQRNFEAFFKLSFFRRLRNRLMIFKYQCLHSNSYSKKSTNS